MASAQGKKKSGGMGGMMQAGGAWAKRSLQGAVLVAVAATVPSAWAAGNGIQVNNVAAGSATFAQNGKVTTVTTGSQNTIINYNRLTVQSGETLKFLQPNSSSRVLNRIDGSSPTRIDGSLLSNGIVYLVNPAGVLFGQGAVINVGQLYAAASHISDADFMAGKNHFTESRGTVTNRGQIQADQVHLVGKHVANFGSIVTGPLGIVTMTAGKDVYLAPADSPVSAPHVLVKISDDPAKEGGTGVLNTGRIESGTVQLGSGDVYAAGIYAGGQIKALSVQMDSHRNTTLSNGVVDASSATGKGGDVEILGSKVAVTGGRVSADGATGGGTVLIGGDTQGLGDVPTSEVAFIGAKARISASAREEGAGGKVVVFAENTARIYGSLQATGAGSGAGGFIETSGKQHLQVTSTPLAGKGGQWLIDPHNLTIDTTEDILSFDLTLGVFSTLLDSATLSVTSIQNALSLGTSVTVTTAGAGLEDGNLLWNSGANLTYAPLGGAGTLTLVATGNVTLNANFAPATAGDKLDLVITPGATKDVTIGGAIDLNGGKFWSTGAAFTSAAGSIAGSEINVLHTGAVTLGVLNAGAGTVRVSGTTVTQAATTTITAGALGVRAAGAVTLNEANAIGTLGAVTTTGNVEVTTAGAVNLDAVTGTSSEPAGILPFLAVSGVTADGDVKVHAGGALTLSNVVSSTTGDVELTTAAGDISGTAAVSGKQLTLNAAKGIGGAGTVNLSPTVNTTLVTGGADGDGNINVTFSGALDLSDLTVTTSGTGTQSVAISSGAGITLNADFDESGDNLSLTATGILKSSGNRTLKANGLTLAGLSIDLSNPSDIVLGTGPLSLKSTGAGALGDISVNVTGNVTTGTIQTAGAGTTVAVKASGDITVGASATLTGDTLQLTSGGDINGTAAAILTAATIDLKATSGEIGGTTAIEIGGGNTTVNANDNVHLVYHTALNTSQVTLTSAGSVVTLEGNSVVVDSALANTGGTLAITSNTGDITDGGGSLKGSTVNVTSAGGVGASGAGVTITASTTGTVTTAGNGAAGNIFVDLGSNTGGDFTFVASGTGTQQVLVAHAGAVTVAGKLDAGTNDLFVQGTGITVNSGKTLTGGNVGLFSGTGDLSLAGSIDATGGTAWLEGAKISQSNGTIKADKLGARSTGTAASDGISLTKSNQVGTVGAVNAAGGGDIAITTSGAVVLDGVTGVGPTGGVPANITSTATNGANLTVQAGGTVTLTSAVNAGSGIVKITASGAGSDIVGAGAVTSGGATLSAGGKIGTSVANKLNLTVGTGDLGLTAGGDIEIALTGNFKTSQLNPGISLTGSGTQLVELSSTGSITVDANVSLGSNNLTLHGTSFSESAAKTITAGVLTIDSTGTVSVGGTNTVGSLVATGTSFTLTTTGSVTASSGTLQVSASGAISLAGDLTVSTTAQLVLQGDTINQTNGSVSATNLVAKATGVGPGAVGVVLGQSGNSLKNVAIGSSVAGGAVTVVSTQALTASSATTALTGTVTGVQANGGDISLKGASVNVANAVSTTGNVSLNGAGGITASAAIQGFDVALQTATVGIGASGSPLDVDATHGLTLTTTGANGFGDIHVNLTGAGHLTALSGVTVSTAGGSGQVVELRGLATLDGVVVNFGNDSVIFVGTGGSLTQLAGSDITGANLSLIADTVTVGGLLHAPGGTITIAPLTSGAPLVVNGLPAGSTASLFKFGNSTTGNVTLAGGLNLTGSGADLTIEAGSGGTITFATTVTMDTNKTARLVGSSGIIGFGLSNSVVGTGVTVVFSNIGGDIGSAVNPFMMAVAHLGNGTDGGISTSGAANVYILNSGALSVDGTVAFSGGANDSFIQSGALTVNKSVTVGGTFTLQANNDVVDPANNLTVNADVKSTGGNVTLNAGDHLAVTTGTVSGTSLALNSDLDGNADATAGDVQQAVGATITATNVSAAGQGITLAGTSNAFATFTAVNGATGTLSITDTAALLTLGAITQNGGGVVSVTSTGDVKQSGALGVGSGTGFDLQVTTHNASGAGITLDANNNIGTGAITLQTLNASTGAVNGSISYVSGGNIHVSLLNSLGTATLQAAGTVDQLGGAGKGITTSGLVVSGTTATLNATNAGLSVNSFSALAANLTGAGVSAISTRAAGGLVLGPTSFATVPASAVNVAGTLNVANETGTVSSTNVLKAGTLNVTATGGIDLSNGANSIGSTNLTNATSGNIHVVNGTDLTVTGVSETGGGTTVVAAGNLTFNGTAGVGSSLTATTSVGGKTFTNNAAITSSGAVAITADGMALNGGSSITVTGVTGTTPTVQLTSETASVQIGINQVDGAGVLGLTGAELATVSVGTTVGNFLQIGDAAHTGDITNGGGSVIVTAPTRFVTQGNVTMSGLSWTYSPGPALGTTDLALEVRHDGTLALGGLSLSGAFSENNIAGTGGGGLVTLTGDILTNSHTVTFNDGVQANGPLTINTATSGNGAAVTFNKAVGLSGAINVVSSNSAATGGNVAFNSTVDGAGSLTVTAGTGTVLVSSNVGSGTPLGVGGFTQNGSGLVTLNGSITTASGAITIHGPVLLTADVTLSTVGGATAGTDVTLTSTVTDLNASLVHSGSNLTIKAGVGNVGIQGAVTTTGAFSSSGRDFTSTAAGTVRADGITVNHTGNVSLAGSLNSSDAVSSARFNVTITGTSITNQPAATITGAAVALDATAGGGTHATLLHGAVDGTGAITSKGGAFTNDGTGTVSGTTIQLTQAGAVNIGAGFTATQGDVTVQGSSIVSTAGGTIDAKNTGGQAVTLQSGTNVKIDGKIDATGLFSSSGTTTFLNEGTGSIKAGGISIVHTGALADVTLDAAVNGLDQNIDITANSIGTTERGTMAGNAITLGVTNFVSIFGTVTGSGAFKSTGGTSFLNSLSSVTAPGSITASSILIDHNGAVTIDSALATTSGGVNLHGSSITTTSLGTIDAIAGSQSVKLTSDSSVQIDGKIQASGLFSSDGNTTFLNEGTGSIKAAGIDITHLGGTVTADAALDGSNLDVNIKGLSISTTHNGTIDGAAITLTANTNVSIFGKVTGSGQFSSSGTGTFVNSFTSPFTPGSITAKGILIQHGGGVTIDAALTATADPVNIDGASIFTTANGTITATSVPSVQTVTLTSDTFVKIDGKVQASGLFKSLGGTSFLNEGTGSITASGIEIDHVTGSVTVDAAMNGTGLNVKVNGLSISTTHNGTIDGAAVTMTSGSNVSIFGKVTASGLFTSTGPGTFLNSFTTPFVPGSITGSGILIDHDGGVTIDAALTANSLNVDISGDAIVTTANGTITATAGSGLVTLTSVHQVQIDGQVQAAGFFKSTGGTSFLNEGTGSITADGILISHATGTVKVDAGLKANGTNVDILGASIETTGNGTITANTVGFPDGQTVTLTSGTFVKIDGTVDASGAFTSSGSSTFLNEGTGSITASGILISHAGGGVTIDAALTANQSPVDIFGASILTTAAGTITADSVGGQTVTLTSGSSVKIDGQVQASGAFTSTGGSTFLNEGTGSITASGILIDHASGSVTVDAALIATFSPVDIFGSSITTTNHGTITADSAAGQTVTLTSGTFVQIDGKVQASDLFTSTGSTSFLNEGTGSITASGILISHAGGSVTVDAALTATGQDVDIFGASITTTANGTITATSDGGQTVTLTSGTFVQIDGQVQATGLFTSTGGTSFLNEGTGSITAEGVVIAHPGGDVTFHAFIDGQSGDVLVHGINITSSTAGKIHGAIITLTATGNVFLDGDVLGTGLFTSTGVDFTNNGSVTAQGVTVTHTGNVLFSGPIDGLSSDVLVHGHDITSDSDGTIHGAIITLTATGNVNLAGNVNGSGLFTSTGIDFTNTGSITAAGITIDHTGNVLADGALNASGLDVIINGASITTTANGTIDGHAITLTSVTSVSIDGTVTGSGLFKSSGTTFLNEGTGSITAVGVTINHTDDVTFHAAINGTSGDVLVNGNDITSDTHGTINGAVITLTATGNVFLDGNVTGSGLFTSTGVDFTNNGSITAVGVTVTHTGNVLFSGPVNGQSGDVLVHGVNITSDSDGTINGAVITLTATGNVTLAGNVTGSGLFTSTGIDFTNTGSVTAAGILIDHTGNVLADGALDGSGLNVDILGSSITTTANGTINGAAITLTAVNGVSIDGTVNGSGLFTSSGTSFLNEGTGSITALGVTINHTGDVTFHAAINGTSGDVLVHGADISSDIHGTINGDVITLTAAGNVFLDGDVTGSGLFTSTGVDFTNNGSITAQGVVVTHTGNVLFSGAVNGQSGDVLVHGNDITSDTDGTINGATITLTAGGNVSLAANVTGSGLFTSTGVDFTNTASITAAGILVTHTGSVLVHGALDGLGNNIDITGASIESDVAGTMNGAAITLTATGGDVTVGGVVTGSALFTSTGANFTNTASITGLGITVTHTGDVLFDAAIDGLSGAVLVNGHKIKSTTNGTIDGAAITLHAGASVVIGGVVTGTGQFLSTGTAFTNTASISASGITLTHTGLVTLGANLTSGGGSGAMSVTGAGVNQTNGIIKAGTLVLHGTGGFSIIDDNKVSKLAADITGPLSFVDTTSLTIGKIGSVVGLVTHDGAVKLRVTSGDLVVNQQIVSGAGGITFEVPTGSVTVTGLLTTTGGFSSTGINFVNNSPITTTRIALHHTGAARIAANLTATNGNIVDDATTVLGANLKASGDIVAPKHVLLVNGPRTVVSGGTGGIRLGSEGGIDAGGSGEDLLVKTTNLSGQPLIEVGRMGTSSARLGNVHISSAHDVILDGDIYAGTLIFEDAVPGLTTFVPSTATISHKGDLLIDLNGSLMPSTGLSLLQLPPGAGPDQLFPGTNFFMERGQKLSVFGTGPQAGDLVIRTNNHNMVLGDIAALGKLTLDAGSTNQTITILNRPASQVLLSDGTTTTLDHGTDIVAGFPGTGALKVIGKVVVNQFVGATPSDRVQIAAFAGSSDLNPTFGKLEFDQNSTSVILTVNSTSVLSIADFQGPGTSVLDIIAHGIGNNPSSSQGSVIPRDVQSFSPEHSQAISGALLDQLRQIGIYARGLRTEEVVEFLVGRALYDDVPLKLNPTAEDNQVAANRLPYQPVFPTVAAYQHLFQKTLTDENGNPVLDEKGQQKVEAQDGTIRNTLGQVWRAYSSSAEADGKATPEGFRAWLEGQDKADPKNAQALDYLNQLRDLLAQIKNLGLTNMEFEVSKTTILARVRPSNIRDTDFMAVITGPSTRRALTSR